MLRVLVVLPFYGGSLPVGRYVTDALREEGCIAETFEAPEFFPAIEALKNLKVGTAQYEAIQHTFLQAVSQAILAKVEAFSPDLVLAMAQAPLTPMALKKLRSAGIPTAMWFVEDYSVFTYWRAFAPLYDVFAVIQKEPFFSELGAIGVKNVLYLPMAAQPSVHRPLELTPGEKAEYGAKISFMGAGYPNRREAFKLLAGRGLKIWGTEWEDDAILAPLVQRNGARVSTEDAVRIFNATEVNINLHSSVSREVQPAHGDFVNPRTFEVASCGAFQLVDRRDLMTELFNSDELAVFENMEDLQEKISWFLNRPDERATIAEKGRTRILAEHTYAHRMRALLDFVKERLPGFGKRAPVPWPEQMPESAVKEMERLMMELSLPPDAEFEDIITAVRAKSSKLSETEAALLFLDEWKKLYFK